jgi:hypothetical protein
MGIWGVNNFENDAADDFKIEVEDEGVEVVYRALVKIYKADTYLDVDDCSEALMASEYVAASNGKPASGFSQKELDWISTQNLNKIKSTERFSRKISLTYLAEDVLLRILENSEIKELWEKSEEYPIWIKIQKDLLKRLK